MEGCQLGRCGGWDDAGQVGVEYGWWMICVCLVGFYACAIPTPPEHLWNVFVSLVE